MTSPWIAHAANFPLAFAQVREDPLLDQWVVDQSGEACDVLMVASGGCTAAYLATQPQVRSLHLVDPNPAQLALARLKLHLLHTAPPQERLSLLGHEPMDAEIRQSRLYSELSALGLPPDALGRLDVIAEVGADHCGRYELLFSELRKALRKDRSELEELLQLQDPTEQGDRISQRTPLGQRLDSAFKNVMALPNLVALFGKGATRNRCEPFWRHFAARTRHALATLPARTNPYLWQMLLGSFPSGALYPWLDKPSPKRMPRITWELGMMAEVLGKHDAAFDVVHLSNILDWLDPADAEMTLHRTMKALRRGGWTIIRQLNSTLNIQSLGGGFTWFNKEAEELHKRDRSFFYRQLHIGKKR